MGARAGSNKLLRTSGGVEGIYLLITAIEKEEAVAGT